MSTRLKGIIAYGTDDDRKKLALIAGLKGKSASETVVEMIRERYRAIYGDLDPNHIA